MTHVRNAFETRASFYWASKILWNKKKINFYLNKVKIFCLFFFFRKSFSLNGMLFIYAICIRNGKRNKKKGGKAVGFAGYLSPQKSPGLNRKARWYSFVMALSIWEFLRWEIGYDILGSPYLNIYTHFIQARVESRVRGYCSVIFLTMWVTLCAVQFGSTYTHTTIQWFVGVQRRRRRWTTWEIELFHAIMDFLLWSPHHTGSSKKKNNNKKKEQ